MFLLIAAVLALLWIFGFIGNIGGGLIHILIILALLSVIYHFVTSRNAA